MSTNTILATTPLVSTNYLLRATGTTIGNSLIFDNGTNVGIGNQGTTYTLDVTGSGRFTTTLLVGGAATFSSTLTTTGIGINYTGALAAKLHITAASSTSYAPMIALRDPDNPTYGFTFKLDTAVNGDMRIDRVNAGVDAAVMSFQRSTGNVGIGTSPSYKLDVLGSSGVIAKFSDGTTNSFIYSGSNSSAFGSDVTIQNGIIMNGANSTAQINTSGQTRLLVTSAGVIFINRTTNWTTFGDSGGAAISSDANGSAYYAVNDGNESLALSRRGSDGTIALFRRSTTTVGTISVTSSATAYNTSSDYRLKQDLKDFNGLSLLSKIKVYDFAWKLDDTRFYGAIAHELQEILPYAVNGEKDAIDEKEEILPQGVDYSKIVPILVKAIQELSKQNEELSNRLIKLESK
jgi:hypothetical protein